MASTKPKIRAARPEDFAAIGEDTLGYDAEAYVIELDGRVIGLGGLVYADDVFAISKFLVECDIYRKIKVKLCYMIYSLMLKCERDVYAVADPDRSTAPGLLEHFCFYPCGDAPGGRLYRWHKPQ